MTNDIFSIWMEKNKWMNNIHVDESWLFMNGPMHEQQVKPHELSLY